MNSLATNASLTAVDVSSLVKETDYDTKISEIKNKITDHNYDKYNAAEIFAARLAKANLITKTDFDTKLLS